MTALAIITTATGVVIASDGGLFDPDGTLRGIAGKPILLPEASAVIVGRGSTLAIVVLKALLAQTMERLTFDGLAEAFPGALGKIAAHVIAEGHPSTKRFSFYLAGWSERAACFQAFAFRSYATDRTAAFSAEALPACYLAPEPPQEIAEELGLRMPSTGDANWRVNPEEYAALVVEAVRFCPGRYVDDTPEVPDRVLSAGLIQLTHVGRLSVSSRIVREWPDKIGKLVDMTAGYDVPEQVRALEPEATR